MKAATDSGFSLIEVLVAVFVLTVGVIGAAGMQLAALRTAQQSAFQTRALHLASELADHMRANTGQMKRDDASNPYLHIDHRADAAVPGLAVHCYGVDAHCNAEELAQFEITELLQRLATELPGGRVRVCRDASPWDESGQRFRWECAETKDGAAASIVVKIGWREKHADGKLVHDNGVDAPAIVLLVAPYAK